MRWNRAVSKDGVIIGHIQEDVVGLDLAVAIVDPDPPVQDIDRYWTVVDDLTEDIEIVGVWVDAAPVITDEKDGNLAAF